MTRSFALALLAGTFAAAGATTASVIWLTITPGARANGMGEAFTAISDDATASYWNPAGLALTDSGSQEITLQHSNWLPQLADDMYFEYLGYARNIPGWGGIGGNITFMSMGEMLETAPGVEEPLGTFYSYGLAADVAFGTEVAPGLAVGLGAKFVYDHLYYSDEGKGTSFAADLGVLYQIPMEEIGLGGAGDASVGASLTNIGPNVSYGGDSDDNPLPRMIRVGIAYEPFDTQMTQLTIAADYSKLDVNVDDGLSEEFGENKWGVGAEYWYYDLLGLRAGYSHDTEGESTISGATFGAGLRYGSLEFDMAFVPVDVSLQGSGKYNKKFSLLVQF